MKNILTGAFLLVVLLCSSALAADINSMGGKWGIGMVGSTPTVRINLSDSMSIDLGLSYVNAPSDLSNAPGTVNSLIFLNLAGQSVGTGGTNSIGWGFLGRHTSNYQNNSDITYASLGLTWGFETLINPRIGLGAIIVPISVSSIYTSTSNTTQWSLFNEADVVAHIYM